MVLPACELDFLPAVLWQLLGAGSVRSAAAFALPPSGPPPGPPASRRRHGDAHGDAAREPQELPELQLTCHGRCPHCNKEFDFDFYTILTCQ